MDEVEKGSLANEDSAGEAGKMAEASRESTGDDFLPEQQTGAAAQAEARLLRRLQMMMNMVMGVIAQDGTLSYDEAAAMVADARTAALAMFPGKELAYDLIWRPRFQRLMRERFRLV